MSTHRKTILGIGVLAAGGIVAGWLAFQSARADDDKNEPKKADASEEKNLKDALEHLRQYRGIVEKLREAENRAKCAENLKQIGIAVHQFQDGKFPVNPPMNWQPYPWPSGTGSQPGNWAMHLLPYIEQDSIYHGYNFYGGARLGATTDGVSPALAAQLGLGDDLGQLIGDIAKDGAAAKAGLQKHDILVELAGKPVPRGPVDFQKLLQAIKGDKPVSAVVLRKGEKVAIKEWKIPAEPKPASLYLTPSYPFQTITDGTSNTVTIGEKYARPDARWSGAVEAPGVSPLVTTHRKEDRFTSRYQEGSLIITVTGTAKDGKHALGRVKVQDGGVEKVYESLDKVPPEYRDKASDLLSAAEKGEGKLDIKK